MASTFARRILFLPCALLFAGMPGCVNLAPVPAAPQTPQTRWETADEVLGRDQTDASSNWIAGSTSLEGRTIGILQFGGNVDGGPSVTQAITQSLLRRADQQGFDVVDRSILETREQELQMDVAGWSNLSEEQQLKRIGEAVAADFIFDGSVSEYASDQMSVALSSVPEPGEVSRYRDEHRQYLEELRQLEAEYNEKRTLATASLVDSSAEIDMKLNEIRFARERLVDPDEFLNDLGTRQRSEFRSVARVGVTGRLIDVSTGRFVWLYRSEHRGFSLQRTVQEAADRLVQKMTEHTGE